MADKDDPKELPSELAGVPGGAPSEPEEEPVPLSVDSQNLVREFDQSNLEVAAMPESNELQERRRKTKNRLKELSDVEDKPDELPEGESVFEDEEAGLMDLFKQANLSPRHFGFCCGGVLVVLVLAGLIYGGISVFKAWESSPSTPDTSVDGSTTPEPTNTTADPTLDAGMMIGLGDEGADSGRQVGEDVGTAASSNDELTELMVNFSKIYNAMQVDVNELMNKATDRRAALTDYQEELNYLLYLGKQNSSELTAQSEALVAQFNAVQDKKDAEEERFFDRIKNLDAYASAAALDTFVAEGQEVVKLRAYYQARQKLLGYYEQILANMENRVEDIKFNEQALVQGIQVVDIEGSDINLIIDEAQL